MSRCLVVSLVLVAAGCVLPPKTVSRNMRRGPIWAQPGSTQIFAWSYRETTKTQRSYSRDIWGGDKEMHWHSEKYNDIDRVHPTVVEPISGVTTALVDYNTEVQPLHWDSNRTILWVVDMRSGIVLGLTKNEVVRPGRGSFGTDSELPLPFVRNDRGDIFNLVTGDMVALDRTSGSGIGSFDGKTLRLTRVSFTMRALLLVEQTVIDWSSGHPQRMPDARHQGPELPELDANREAWAVLPDGRVAEVVTSRSAGTQLYIHNVVTHEISAMPVGSLQPADSYSKPTLFPLGPDTLAYVVKSKDPDGDSCYRGMTIALANKVVVPVPNGICIDHISGRPGRAWIDTGARSGYVGDDAHIKTFAFALKEPLILGRTMIAYPRPVETGGVDVETFDFATGAFQTLAHHANGGDTLLNVTPGSVVFASGADKIVTELPDGKPIEMTLPPVGD